MIFVRIIDALDAALDRAVDRSTPWLIGFTFIYITGHILVALLKGWL